MHTATASIGRVESWPHRRIITPAAPPTLHTPYSGANNIVDYMFSTSIVYASWIIVHQPQPQARRRKTSLKNTAVSYSVIPYGCSQSYNYQTSVFM